MRERGIALHGLPAADDLPPLPTDAEKLAALEKELEALRFEMGIAREKARLYDEMHWWMPMVSVPITNAPPPTPIIYGEMDSGAETVIAPNAVGSTAGSYTKITSGWATTIFGAGFQPSVIQITSAQAAEAAQGFHETIAQPNPIPPEGAKLNCSNLGEWTVEYAHEPACFLPTIEGGLSGTIPTTFVGFWDEPVDASAIRKAREARRKANAELKRQRRAQRYANNGKSKALDRPW